MSSEQQSDTRDSTASDERARILELVEHQVAAGDQGGGRSGHQWVATAGAALAILAVLVGALIALSRFAHGKAEATDVALIRSELDDRVRSIEANDIRQTVLLEQIGQDLAEVSKKLDRLSERGR